MHALILIPARAYNVLLHERTCVCARVAHAQWCIIYAEALGKEGGKDSRSLATHAACRSAGQRAARQHTKRSLIGCQCGRWKTKEKQPQPILGEDARARTDNIRLERLRNDELHMRTVRAPPPHPYA